MLINTPSIEQLSTVISQVTGPAFLLAAEAQLLAVSSHDWTASSIVREPSSRLTATARRKSI